MDAVPCELFFGPKFPANREASVTYLGRSRPHGKRGRTHTSRRLALKCHSFTALVGLVGEELATAAMVDYIVNGVDPDIAGLALLANSL